MKNWFFAISIFFVSVALCAVAVPARADADANQNANSASVKLPYAKGQSYIVSQGYNSLPTHIKKDAYALDFTQNACVAYGKAVVAAAPGKIMFMSQEGYNGGYGTELIIDHGNNIVSRYAHMIPDSIAVALGDRIEQGETIGSVGDTGLVAGAACADHPGTHLHFAMDTVNTDGTFSAYDPEPVSGYTNMTEGKWYVSDNGENDAIAAPAPAPNISDGNIGEVLGAYTTTATSTALAATTTATSTASAIAATPTTAITASSAMAVIATATIAVMQPIAAPQITNNIPGGVLFIPAPASSTPFPVENSSSAPEASSTSESASSSVPVVSASSSDLAPAVVPSSILFSQTDDEAQSPASFYDDNWFDLGNGFSGTLNALTLEGRVNNPDYLASHIYLEEFKDQNYTAMIQQFLISDSAPFTDVMATATFSGLSIPLKPYLYYRLSTIQDWQNRSVILAGTPSTTVGVVMWDNFIYGTGGVQSTSTYFPYMIMQGVAATSTLTPPPLPPPSDLIIDFDPVEMQITPSFSIATDPEWPANPLHFEMNYSTSTSLSDDGWTPLAPIPVIFGDSYLFGVRAEDNFGDISAPATIAWNFPPGFAPYILSPQLTYASQYFSVSSTFALQSIALFATNFQTGSRNPDTNYRTLELHDGDRVTQSDGVYTGYGCMGNPIFSFASSSPVLSPGRQYQWVFTMHGGNVQLYGTVADTAGGAFSDPSLANARFIVDASSGMMFAN